MPANGNCAPLWPLLMCTALSFIHVAVTSNPTLDWVKQQLHEATAWGKIPRFLMHDNDGIFGQLGGLHPVADGATGLHHRCALDAWLEDVLGSPLKRIPFAQ